MLSQTLFSVLRGHNKVPQTGRLKRQKCIVSQFRSWSQDQSTGWGDSMQGFERDCFHLCACRLADNLHISQFIGVLRSFAFISTQCYPCLHVCLCGHHTLIVRSSNIPLQMRSNLPKLGLPCLQVEVGDTATSTAGFQVNSAT